MSVPAIESRKAWRAELISRARDFASHIPDALGVSAVVIAGSVARGDFNLWSDVDLVVVTDNLAPRLLDRFDQLGPRPPSVEPHPMTRAEARSRLARGDPLVLEAMERGIWLVGSPEALQAAFEEL
jgi:predicted nucleotidyltransferase